MHCSIIIAHPTPGSFNHAIAERAAVALKRLGYGVWWHDLYAEEFDPVMTGDEIPKDARLAPMIERHCEEIAQADGIIIVHPNWWSQPPAILKGWLDRVLRPGRAYNFVADATGEGKAVGLLRARAALVVNTANNPQEKEVALLGDPLGILWQKCVFGLCGVANYHRLVLSPVVLSSPAQRGEWLQQVAVTVEGIFEAKKGKDLGNRGGVCMLVPG
jgi:putative NADPH-quinone reductase